MDVAPHAGVKPGVVQMMHGWGGLSGDTSYDRHGANNGLLIGTDRNLEPINAMSRMSAALVNIRPVQAAAE